MADLQALSEAVFRGDQQSCIELTKAAVEEGIAAEKILNEGMISAMDRIGEGFSKNEIYIPEMLIAARAMKSAMGILEPELVKAGVEPIGKLIIGTAAGDLHDIGKNLVAMMLKGAGFDVIDLGVDVSAEKFIEQAKSTGAQIVGMSALLTTTMASMEEVVKALKGAEISAKVIIGGAPVTQAYADKIGADGYAADAAEAVTVAKGLVA
jgi:5-methyltetrahydrofolate--homocysteine methyltransferase